MRHKHRSSAAYLSSLPSIAKQTPQAIADIFTQLVQPIKSLGRHLPHGFKTGRNSHRIRIEGSAVMYFESPGVIEDRHHPLGSAHAANWKPAADDLSESREVRRDAGGVKGAVITETKVQDFISDQNNSVTRSLFAQKLQESRAGRNHPDS